MAVRFASPIWIREGALFFRTIESGEEGLAYLNAYSGDRGAVYHFTKQAMQRAVNGELSVDDARLAFWRFAEDVGILGETALA
ncbi:DUF982 domain-containing protein [Mesorhizobium sp. KR9-304]|uniref:DUF982 domain-containing protein n=1 Tax=Mesorhizobium sp. KR9-304 TaxID=3156614 RepID=UPI0032B3F53D